MLKNKFAIIIVIAVIVAGWLVISATTTSANTVYMPSELAELTKSNPNLTLSRIRVAGKVADAPISYELEPRFELKFSIVNPSRDPHQDREITAGAPTPIRVVYNGIKPDMFAVGRDVILDGEYRDGTIDAIKLLTQCPSKYEPKLPSNLPMAETKNEAAPKEVTPK